MPNPISRMSVRPQSHRASPGWAFLVAIAVAGLALARTAPAEDGYRLWLRYVPVQSQWLARYRASTTELIGANASPSLRAAQAELVRGLTGLLGSAPRMAANVTQDGAL